MNTQINQQMSFGDIIGLIILSVIWGGSFFFIEVLVDFLPPLTIVTLRVGLAAILLWAIVVLRKLPVPDSWQKWRALIFVGIFNNALPFCLIVWGQTQITSGLASVLNATAPFFTVIIAGLYLADEKYSLNKFFGVVMGMIGTAVLIGPGVIEGVSGSMLGQLAVMAAAFSYAVSGVYARRFKVWGVSPLLIATGQVTMATLVLIPLTLFIDQPWTLSMPPLYGIGAILGLSIISTVLAYIIYFRLVASAGATNAALVTFLIPISAILLGVLILGEAFSLRQATGALIIGLGLIIMDGRLLSRR